MALHPAIKRLSDLNRKRANLRAKLATVTLDLAECERDLARVALELTNDEPQPSSDRKDS